MGTVKKIKQAAAAFYIPQHRDEVAEAIAKIGRLQRERQRIEADMNDELAVAKQKYEDRAAPLNTEIRDLSKGVQAYCEAHRVELTQGNKVKHAALSSGEIKWRTRPPSLTVRGKEAVIELLKKLGLGKFVRTKEEVNKEAILLEPDQAKNVPGISISQGEDFVIVPFESQLEEVA